MNTPLAAVPASTPSPVHPADQTLFDRIDAVLAEYDRTRVDGPNEARS
ncbi:MAG: hypothetical protein ABWZ15_01935 [Acidimicrobiia bacterium]